MKRVVILYRFLPQYRIPFYEGLRSHLYRAGVELSLVYGDGDRDDRAKGDLVDLEWATPAPNRILTILGAKLYWQPVLEHVRRADLVIVEQASRLLVNYLLLGQQALGLRRVAFWGHGKNFQADRHHGIAELIKRRVSTMPAWWFAYNQRSADIVAELGYPKDRITIVQNAIDTTGLRGEIASVTAEQRKRLTTDLGITGRMVGVYVGGLYPEKRLDFLVDAARRVHSEVPEFELVIAGDGPDHGIVERAAAANPWIRYVGPVFGDAKARLLSSSKMFLIPGLVGLAVLDAFAAALPMATTDLPFHSPEIEYLKPGVNGIITDHEPDAYAGAIIRLIRNPLARQRMGDAALAASRHYTIENMVRNFGDGVLLALDRANRPVR